MIRSCGSSSRCTPQRLERANCTPFVNAGRANAGACLSRRRIRFENKDAREGSLANKAGDTAPARSDV
jgi:hypothetical protein